MNLLFQSTRPRGARPAVLSSPLVIIRVSIHAPAGGATYVKDYGYIARGVSIHAPAGGATFRLSFFRLYISVSIHAPAGGATLPIRLAPAIFGKFQSTRPRGARPPFRAQVLACLSFNPRARGGRDPDCGTSTSGTKTVSIHAPAGGATVYIECTLPVP